MSTEELGWLGVVRHGQSTGNLAAIAAEGAGVEVVDIEQRDADVTLTPAGREQASAVGRWLAGLPAGQRPQLVVSSPYRRATETAELALAALADLEDTPPLRVDERIRDRELGILDRLTARGVRSRYPSEAERKERLGRFYYRPPGGESWADVALRIRGTLGDLRREQAGRRVLLVAHEAVILLLRYLVEELTEARLDELSRQGGLGNGSLTCWQQVNGRLRLADFNRLDHLIPNHLAPDGLAPDGLAPDGLAPDGLAPDGLAPDGLAPDGLAPDGLAPDGLAPDGLAPDGLAPDGLAPDHLSTD
jgi:broad specificity phosphatase PhoE